MVNIKGPEGDMGVIIARFQTPFLTDGHRELIESVKNRHKKFAIVLGIAKVIPSTKNPLDFTTRYHMILEEYPGVEILAIHDVNNDELWSQTLDTTLRNLHPHENIVLYGGRDSFISHYFGKFKTVELESGESISGTIARQQAFHDVRTTEDFRRGVCYATANQYRKNVLCVDVAVIRNERGILQVLLARKNEDGQKWRFIGGHVDVGTETLEQAGRREVQEEASCSVGDMKYIGNTPIEDWRYNGTRDGIFTVFFAGHFLFGPTIGGDDVCDVKWFNASELDESVIVSEHHVLLDMFLRYYHLRGTENHVIEDSEAVDFRNFEYKTVNKEKVYTTPVPAKEVSWADTKLSTEGLDIKTL
jgi:bifunctional NMN adenylyltransferase/nudix hydrolase